MTAKLLVSKTQVRAALDALQILGGYGYVNGYLGEGEVRNVLAGKIYSGRSEMQRKIIARGLGL